MSKIEIVNADITRFKADCIVNAANDGLWEGGGVCGAIFRAAGSPELTHACQAIGHCDTGRAVITPGFRLPAKYIIHAVGPVYRDGRHHEPQQLYDCYKHSLQLARQNGCHSIAFPLISSGIFGYPTEEAWRKALQACRNYLQRHPDYELTVYFTVISDEAAALGQRILRGLESAPKKDTLKPAAPRAGRTTQMDRIDIFSDTISWIQADSALAQAVEQAAASSMVFFEDDYPPFDASEKHEQITVSPDRTYQAAMRLAQEYPGAKIAVMNFANAFHPGGGVRMGASAQEESLCRCSTLYPVLKHPKMRSYYQHHRRLNHTEATDALIYSEDIIICKTDDDYPQRLDAAQWLPVDVITIAAPDLRSAANPYAELADSNAVMHPAVQFGYHVKRAMHLLTVAAAKGVDVLILGAFGCGAFENDPAVVARAYRTALNEFPKVFRRVEFAVYCTPERQMNYQVFRSTLE